MNASRVWKLKDWITPTTIEFLDATLKGYLPVKSGNVEAKVPCGYHLAYFNPRNAENTLDDDGYESHQAPVGYPSRMWVGGSVYFENALKTGEPATLTESISEFREENDRAKVTIQRLMHQNESLSIKELRTLMYFKSRPEYNPRVVKTSRKAAYSHVITPTDILLFRYSALTFNSHKIHLDREYTRQIENLPDLLVQGPLMVTMMLQWISTLFPKPIESFGYKNLSPLFVNQQLRLCCSEIRNDRVNVWIENNQGSMALSGTISLAV